MALVYINLVVFALVHLAGLVVSAILLVKIKGTPAILSTVAFGILFLHDLGAILRAAFLDTLVARSVRIANITTARGGFDCCCNILTIAAFVCLIIAIWQAVAGPKAEAEA